MEERERLTNQEIEPQPQSEETKASPTITLREAEEICAQRRRVVEELKPFVYRKLINEMTDKIEAEKEAFDKLLHWQSSKDELLSQYSFVLNPYYFEQKFFSESL